MHASPVVLALGLDCAYEDAVRFDLDLLDQTPLARPVRLDHVGGVLIGQAVAPQHTPGGCLDQTQRGADDPLDAVVGVCDVCLKGHGGVPQASGQGVHGVCDLVAFCGGRGGRRRESLVVGELRVEADEEVVVLQLGEGMRKGGRGRQVGDVVEAGGGAECWAC